MGSAILFGGTGRFADVTGEVLSSGVSNSDGTFTVQHKGGGSNSSARLASAISVISGR